MAPDEAAASLDVVDLKCPLPVLKARKALGALSPGAVLEVLASDPGAAEDFAAFCGATGHRLIGQSETGGIQRFLIQKGPSEPA
ncbi:sulfurtransferase TusA family protein [uncultured Hyphomicrobium sp.]|uniref:sulfurtransferase TusA family protein n=1 Tax=uncultured Hyphomicrobium sp. TaxID=194373 RepID=UPI0025F6F21E|nr:sulfurtransferase TusA family protein [uncultured Hyphomicrobium sp.]